MTLIKGLLTVCVSVIFLLSGCASNNKKANNSADVQSFLTNKPEELKPFFKVLFIEGERNAVLNYDRLGLAAMENGYYDIAKIALDNAISRIDAIYADNPIAEKARSKFHAEKIKDFKGEAYERAMTYYYRGLLYLKDGEYDNARAAFLGASLQDKFSENQTYDQDMGVMDYLAGWSSMCMGNQPMAEEQFKIAMRTTPSLSPIATAPGKFLAIMDSGYPPVKKLKGGHAELVDFTENNKNSQTKAHLVRGNVEIGNLVLAGDNLHQATTRGTRAVDLINKDKAEFKETGEDIANHTKYTTNALVSLVYFTATAVSAASTAVADVRTWEGVPKDIWLSAVDHTPDDLASLRMKIDSSTDALPFKISSQSGECGFVWGHFPNASQIMPFTQVLPEDVIEERETSNLIFRGELKKQFL